jgi:hypothetical protein
MTYSIQIYRMNAGSWETLAMFTPTIFDEMVEAGRAMFVNPLLSAENVAIVDDLTGEVLWDACSEDEDCEPADIDDDCGFDPYMGCYTDDV